MYPFLRPFLGRGGAGRYVSREETVERLSPFAARHHRLLRAYAHVLARLDGAEARERLDALMPYARTEAAKLTETLYSLGARRPPALGAEPEVEDTGSTDAARLRYLLDMEQAYHDDLLAEVDAVHHQERTRSILQAVAKGSAGRMDVLRTLTSHLPRPATHA